MFGTLSWQWNYEEIEMAICLWEALSRSLSLSLSSLSLRSLSRSLSSIPFFKSTLFTCSNVSNIAKAINNDTNNCDT